jgi:choloylglycine hydrolase
MVQQFQEINTPPVEYAFDILGKVAQGSFTKWSIVYDITNRQIHFFTHNNRQHKTIALNKFDFNCSQPPLAFDMGKQASGSINNLFFPLNFETNKALVEKSVGESSGQVQIPELMVKEAVSYFNSAVCGKERK